MAAVISEEGFGGLHIRLRPHVEGNSAIRGDQLVQVGGEVRHRFHIVDAGGPGHARCCRIHLGAGVGFHAQIARGQEEDFLVIARVRGLAGALGLVGWADDHQRCAGLVPAGQVVEVRILAIGIEVEHRLFRGEEDGNATVQGIAKRNAASVVVTGGLFFECLGCGECKRQAKLKPVQRAGQFHFAIVARHASHGAKAKTCTCSEFTMRR